MSEGLFLPADRHTGRENSSVSNTESPSTTVTVVFLTNRSKQVTSRFPTVVCTGRRPHQWGDLWHSQPRRASHIRTLTFQTLIPTSRRRQDQYVSIRGASNRGRSESCRTRPHQACTMRSKTRWMYGWTQFQNFQIVLSMDASSADPAMRRPMSESKQVFEFIELNYPVLTFTK